MPPGSDKLLRQASRHPRHGASVKLLVTTALGRFSSGEHYASMIASHNRLPSANQAEPASDVDSNAVFATSAAAAFAHRSSPAPKSPAGLLGPNAETNG